jgi:hypothetical protein
MSQETAPQPEPASPPAEAPPPAPPPAPADPDEPEAPPATPPAEAPPKVDLAAVVMKQRDASQLAALVREKKQLEATAAKYKSSEAKLAALAKIEQLMDDGDRAGAIVELHRLKFGDKAAAELADSYNSLTRHVLGKQNESSPEIVQVKREVSRNGQEIEALKRERDQYQAKLAEKEAAEYQRWERGAVEDLGSYLKSTADQFPYLVAEVDQPEEVVWEILKTAAAQGQNDLTYEQAAQLANEHFKPTAEKKAARYQNLLASKASGNPPKPEAAAKPTSAPPRKSLTNADASQASTEKSLPPPRNDQERLDRSFAVLQRAQAKPQ